MSWQERLKEAAYTSPSGQRLVFMYENVAMSFEKKGAAYDFPDADGTYIQDLGRTGRRLPCVMYFSGANCDLQADLLLAMLGESGDGKLEHPMYGMVNVVPMGEVGRRDDLKTAANQSIVEATFFETTGVVYPTSQRDAGSEVLQALSAYTQAVAEQFAASVALNSPSARAGLAGDFLAALGTARSALEKVADANAEVKRKFTAINRSIVTSMDDLIGDPLVLALQATLFVQSPASAITARVESRLDAYKAILDTIRLNVETSKGYGARNSNAFKARDVIASGAVSGQVLSVVNNQFSTKSDAIVAAEYVLDQMEVLTAWREANYNGLGEVDSGESYSQLQNSVALAAGYLVEISFTLRQERAIYLDRERTIVDLSAELYGEIDSQLDFLISSNALSGSEVLELPRGRRIVYYV